MLPGSPWSAAVPEAFQILAISVSGFAPWQLAQATGAVVDHSAWPFKDETPRGPTGTDIAVVGEPELAAGAGVALAPGAGVVPVPDVVLGVGVGVGVGTGVGVEAVGVPGADVATNDVKYAAMLFASAALIVPLRKPIFPKLVAMAFSVTLAFLPFMMFDKFFVASTPWQNAQFAEYRL
jgi:hypothetical protein